MQNTLPYSKHAHKKVQGIEGQLTNFAVPSVKYIAQLDHHCVAPTPQRPVSSGVNFQAPCYLQRCHSLLYVTMDVPNYSTGHLLVLLLGIAHQDLQVDPV